MCPGDKSCVNIWALMTEPLPGEVGALPRFAATERNKLTVGLLFPVENLSDRHPPITHLLFLGSILVFPVSCLCPLNRSTGR